MSNGKQRVPRIGGFGGRELDDRPFDTYRPFPLPHSHEAREPELPERAASYYNFPSPAEGSSNTNMRKKRKKRPSTSIDLQKSVGPEAEPNVRSGDNNPLGDVQWTAHGKHLPNSPMKDPQRKLRRTLLEDELKIEAFSSPARTEVKRASTRSVLDRKRKDALYDDSTQIADPGVLANRHILRLRNPTPNSSGHHGFPVANDSTVPGATGRDHHKNGLHHQYEGIPPVDGPTGKLAEELASLALNAAQDVSGDVRKPSVTTADFFNKAQQIMQLI